MPTVRCEPVHTHSVPLPNDARQSAYTTREFGDGFEEYGPAGAYAAFLAGWPIVDAVGTSPMILTGGWAYWINVGPLYYIQSRSYSNAILWDFSLIPVGSTILSSTFHIEYTEYNIGFGSAYYPAETYFHNMTLPGLADGELWRGDIIGGTAWPIGGTAWLVLENRLVRQATEVLPSSTPGNNVGRRAAATDISPGWGLYSDGDYAYIDVTYADPPTVTSVLPNSGARGTP